LFQFIFTAVYVQRIHLQPLKLIQHITTVNSAVLYQKHTFKVI